jgi:hypothetical protein
MISPQWRSAFWCETNLATNFMRIDAVPHWDNLERPADRARGRGRKSFVFEICDGNPLTAVNDLIFHQAFSKLYLMHKPSPFAPEEPISMLLVTTIDQG